MENTKLKKLEILANDYIASASILSVGDMKDLAYGTLELIEEYRKIAKKMPDEWGRTPGAEL